MFSVINIYVILLCFSDAGNKSAKYKSTKKRDIDMESCVSKGIIV